jgi:hypothetical protein
LPVVIFVSGLAGRKTAPAPPDRSAQVVALVQQKKAVAVEAEREETRAERLKHKLKRAKHRITRLGRIARYERTKAWKTWRRYLRALSPPSGASAAGFGFSSAQSEGGLIAFGRELQALGYHAGENCALGDCPSPGVHAGGSYHYQSGPAGPESRAIDVTGGNLDWVAEEARRRGFNVYWQVPGHYDHVHVDDGPVRPYG